MQKKHPIGGLVSCW